MLPLTLFLVIFSGAMFVVIIPLSFLVIYHRKYFPISGIMYEMLLVTALGFYMTYISTIHTSPGTVTDFWFRLIPLYIGTYLVVISYTIRAFILWFRYKIGEGVRLFRHDGTTTWFLAKRALISHKNITGLVIVDLSLYLIMLIFLPANRTTMVPSPSIEHVLWFFLAVHCLACVLLAFGMRRFSHDGFYLKSEFRNVGVILLTTFICQLVLGGQHGQIAQTIGLAFAVFISLFLPVYRSYAARDADTSKSLSKYLAGSQEHWDAYFKFLELEFCSESLLFWTEIQNLRTMNDRDALKEKDRFVASVKYVYNNFVALSGPLPVNISATSRGQVVQAMGEWESQQWSSINLPDLVRVFEPAESEVYRIMNLGTFPRFMRWKAQQKGSSGRKDSSHRKDHSRKSEAPQLDLSSQVSITQGGSPRSLPSTSSGTAGSPGPKPAMEVVITATDVDASNKIRESVDVLR